MSHDEEEQGGSAAFLDDVGDAVLRCVPVSLLGMRRLLDAGRENAVTEVDMVPRLATRDNVETLMGRMERSWAREVAAAAKRGLEPSLWSAVAACFAFELIEIFWVGTLRIVVVVVQAVLFQPFLGALADGGSLTTLIAFGAAIVVGSAINSICLARETFGVELFAFRAKISLLATLHAKLLRTRAAAVAAEVAAGRAYTMLTSDAIRFETVYLLYGPFFAILGTSAAFLIMSYHIGFASALAGTGVLSLCIVAQLALSRSFGRRRKDTVKATDDRIKLTSEVLQSMFSVKTCGWEKAFEKRIEAKRAVEAASIRRAQILVALSSGLNFASPAVAAFAAFSTHAFLNDDERLALRRESANLSVGKAASVLALFWVAKDFLVVLSKNVLTIPAVKVSCQRMGKFLSLPEVDEAAQQHKQQQHVVDDRNKSKAVIEEECKDATQGGHDDILVRVDDAALAWSSGDLDASPVVLSVSLSVRRGEFVAVVGETGCGKSALLHAILGELDVLNGSIDVPAKQRGIAFSPQRSWNFSGSVRENVVLAAGGPGAPVDEEVYATALTAAALDADCAEWTDGDETIVGEKGLTLSGGQAARLALARCVYAAGIGRTNLVIADDPLSAVDPKVAQHLVEHCVRDCLCRELNVGVLLATHQRQFLDRADRVVVLARDGTALANAPLADILEQGGEAADLVRVEDDDDDEIDEANRKTVVEDQNGYASWLDFALTRDTSFMWSLMCSIGPDHIIDDPPTTNKISPEDEPPNEPTFFESAKHKAVAPPLQVVSKEDQVVGDVKARTWFDFIGRRNAPFMCAVVCLFLAAEACLMYADLLVLRWSERKQQRTSSDIFTRYATFVAAAFVAGPLQGVMFFALSLNASSTLHSSALRHVLHAPLSWIQANPLYVAIRCSVATHPARRCFPLLFHSLHC